MSILEDSLHHYQLFDSIQLQDDCSFHLDIGHTRHHLWILQYFGHLEIESVHIKYKVSKSIRQRKNTVHPIRNLRDRFNNTFELCTYLHSKFYDILRFRIEFTNGWKIEDWPAFIAWRFTTNNLPERDALIAQLFQIAAIPAQNLKVLETGKTYMIKAGNQGQYIEEYVFKDFEDYDIEAPF